MGRARDLASQAIFVNDTGNDSYIINGDMKVLQRGSTAATQTGGGYFSADRWRYTQNGSFGSDVTPVIGHNANANNGEFANAITFTTTVGSSIAATDDAIYIEQRIEGQNLVDLRLGTSSAQPMTLSFWVKCSLTGTFGVGLYNDFSPNVTEAIVETYTINTADTWEYKTITFPAPTSGTFATDNTTGLAVGFNMGGGSDHELSTTGTWTNQAVGFSKTRTSSCVNVTATTDAVWELTGVKLEKGLIATPFKHESYSENLAKCQRYFAAFGGWPINTGNNNTPAGRIYSETYATTASTITWWLPVPMRDIPTEQLFALGGDNGGTKTDWSTKDMWRQYDGDDTQRYAYNIRMGCEL